MTDHSRRDRQMRVATAAISGPLLVAGAILLIFANDQTGIALVVAAAAVTLAFTLVRTWLSPNRHER